MKFIFPELGYHYIDILRKNPNWQNPGDESFAKIIPDDKSTYLKELLTNST